MKKKVSISSRKELCTRFTLITDFKPSYFGGTEGAPIGQIGALGDSSLTVSAYAGTERVGTLRARVLQVPMTAAGLRESDSSAKVFPAKQFAIDWLRSQMAMERNRCEMRQTDSLNIVLPISTHIYIEELFVNGEHRREGIATAMIDVANEAIQPTYMCAFSHAMDNALGASLSESRSHAFFKTLGFAYVCDTHVDLPWNVRTFWAKRAGPEI